MKKFIKEFKVGELMEGFFLLKKKELLKTRENRPYLKLSLADKTGEIEGRVWENADTFNRDIEQGIVVFAKGTVDSWKNNIQVKIDQIRTASKEEYSTEEIIRTVENRDELLSKIIDYLKSIKTPWILRLAESITKDEDFIKRFITSPGAKSWHNAYIGGLLEHTYEVMFITDNVCSLYPQVNRDIALMGAFLHDIGKIWEINPETFEYTKEGGLIGHLSIGFRFLAEKIRAIKDFPKEIELRLEHIILSHHGEYEQQSPVLPKTIEATIVYHADELVSQANAVKEIKLSQSGNERIWSNYISIKNRKYLLENLPENEKF